MPSNRPRFRLSLLVVLTVVVGVLAQTSSAEPEDNAPPEAVSDDISTAKGTPGDVNVLVNDSDPDDDPLTVESWTQGNDGSVTCTGAGACVYMPTDPSFHGADSFTYTVADGHGGTAIGDVFVLVTTTNGQPDATDDELTVVEDEFGTVAVLTNDADPDEDPLVLTTPSPVADHGTVACTSAGLCTYTPDPDFFGTDVFSYEIDDGQGGADTGEVAVTVTPVNDDPDAVGDSLTVAEDSMAILNVRLNDVDVDGDTLFVTTATPTAAHGTVSCIAGGACTYTPTTDYNGPDSFQYSVSDNSGGTATATVSVTVTPENTRPIADDEDLTTAEDTTGSVNVLPGDTDIDGDSLSVSTPAPTAEHGTVSCTAGGSCAYTPSEDYSGDDSFEYTVSDGRGGSDVGLVSVTVTAANDPPVAGDDSLTAAEDGDGQVGVLANDADEDGGALSVTDSTNGAHGTVDCVADGTCTYTPSADYSGADTFTYTVSDGNGGTDTGSVTVTVTPANDAPVAADDLLTTTVDTPADVDVLANDLDVDGDAVVEGPSDPEHGSVTCEPTGSCTYTPDSGYLGPDSFTYTVGDGEESDQGLVSVTVEEPNLAPACGNVKPSKTSLWPPLRQFIVITLFGATDPDGDALVFSITTVKQDEKTRGIGGSTDKGPDAQRLSGKPHQIKLRAERDAKANGRVYSIAYEVSDDRGGKCTGVEKVGVPVKKGKKAVATAKSFNSFG